MQVNLLIWMCSVLLLLLSRQCTTNLVDGESETIKAANKTSTNNNSSSNTNYTISNFQTKTVNSSNLPEVQLQEAKDAAGKEKFELEADKESTKNDKGSIHNSGEKSQSRKITNTGNNNVTTNNTAENPQKHDEAPEMVAENVALTDLKGIAQQMPQNQTLKAAPITNVSTNSNATNSTDVFPAKPTTITTKTDLKIFPNVISNNSSNKTSNATASTTTTTTTTKTTTTTTTPKPKKPTITYGIEDFSHLEGETPLNTSSSSSSKPPASSKLPTAPETAPIREPPNAEPSQEMNSSSSFPYNSSRDYIVPILTILFTVPLAIGVVITAYRRFKDCWSTRHYHRMDFLVDGMYND